MIFDCPVCEYANGTEDVVYVARSEGRLVACGFCGAVFVREILERLEIEPE